LFDQTIVKRLKLSRISLGIQRAFIPQWPWPIYADSSFKCCQAYTAKQCHIRWRLRKV